jgi:acyl carrier protein phosphodiesterase
MNFLAHSAVAQKSGLASPHQVLGAVLSDLGAMAGLRFASAELPADVALGMRCHWASDRAFHGDPTFLEGARQLRAAAADAGFGPGASRAIGHAGWELLLDGTEPARTATDHFVAALEVAAALQLPASGPQAAAAWARLTERLSSSKWWLHYDDPAFVAERLFGMLGRRPRLAFPRDAVDLAAGVLARSRPEVDRHAAAVIGRVVERLGSDTDWRAP